MLARIDDVHAAAEHRNRAAPALERAAVRRRVDAASHAADYGDTAAREVGPELPRDFERIRGMRRAIPQSPPTLSAGTSTSPFTQSVRGGSWMAARAVGKQASAGETNKNIETHGCSNRAARAGA